MSILNKLSHNELIKLAYERVIPPLLPNLYKGQSSKVCVIGGCEDYTGAPFFSAHAAALMGCDLTHVICEKNAASVIKGYTPNLMVHPYIDIYSNGRTQTDFEKIKLLLKRMYVIVIGPGLGRDPKMLADIKNIIKIIVNDFNGEIPIVMDADSLYMLSVDDELIDMIKRFPKGKIVLTPNVIEFQRLYTKLFNDDKSTTDGTDDLTQNIFQKGVQISEELQCAIVCKGKVDNIILSVPNNKEETITLENSLKGSNKRVGGQGDTLTGTIACMLAYSRAIHDFKILGETKDSLTWSEYLTLSCYVGCSITRTCSKLAYEEKGRSMQTTDMNNYVGKVFQMFFPDKS